MLPKNPSMPAAGKQLNLHDHGSAVFSAHKQMFLGMIGGSFEDETRPEREQIHTATARRRRIASHCLYYGAVS
jgi:hypothetical protein